MNRKIGFLFKRRRGQIRAVDFVVSLFLFLLMLSQLILLIINVQSGIISTREGYISYDELDIFGRAILQKEGDPNWGYQQGLPDNFGLAIENSHSGLTLDPSKIARLITGTTYPISSVSGFDIFDYSTLKNWIHLESEYDFQLTLTPSLNVDLSVTLENTSWNNLEVFVSGSNEIPIENAIAQFWILDLTDGEIINNGIQTTDQWGEVVIQYEVPNLNDPERAHIPIVIVSKFNLWGLDWVNPNLERAVVGTVSNTTLWLGGTSPSTMLVSDILESTGTLDTHFLSILYEDTNGVYKNISLDVSTSLDANESLGIPSEGLVVCFSISKFDSVYKVGVGTYPAILDNDLSASGSFYQIFGELTFPDRIRAMISKDFPVIVRGLSMKCQITLWREG